MLATAYTTVLIGMEAQPVRVEVEAVRGVPKFELVGLAEASVRESHVRVRSALHQLGLQLGQHRMVVNLAPADLRKQGSAFDLAIASAAIAALGHLDVNALDSTLILGELSLNGAVRPVRGVLPQLMNAQRHGIKHAIVPAENGQEASAVDGIDILVAEHLQDVWEHFKGTGELDCPGSIDYHPCFDEGMDLADVKGQPGARRILEVAAAGAHHLLMIGPPGGGKTMLARRIPSVLPPLDRAEAMEVTAIHSVAGLLPADSGLIRNRPFRAPHHTVSDAGLVGGGVPPRPGEVSLAHRGVLFLDELAEFRRSAIEALRQPLEDGTLTIARARTRATFPAQPLLVAAVNPCPCGFAGDPSHRCKCGEHRIQTYRSKLSGPLLDRIDLHVNVPPVEIRSLRDKRRGESSETVRDRVIRAREVQKHRRKSGEVEAWTNSQLSPGELDRIAAPDADGVNLLVRAVDKLGLSARAYTKALRVARTIADMEGSDFVKAVHVAEAISGRILDRKRAPSS